MNLAHRGGTATSEKIGDRACLADWKGQAQNHNYRVDADIASTWRGVLLKTYHVCFTPKVKATAAKMSTNARKLFHAGFSPR